MYRSASPRSYGQQSAGVSRSAVERLLSERDALASDRQTLVAEVRRLQSLVTERDADVRALHSALAEVPETVDEPVIAAMTDETESARVAGLLADLDNVRRHAARAEERATHAERARSLTHLAATYDDVRRAVEHAEGTPVQAGLRVVLTQLARRVQDAGGILFGQSGETFDPSCHDAVGIDEDTESGVLSAVLTTGVRLADGAVVRPAQVIVGQ